jgi:hypothetical protein
MIVFVTDIILNFWMVKLMFLLFLNTVLNFFSEFSFCQ